MSEIQFNADEHIYTLGKLRLPSVTQILKQSGIIDDRWFTPESARFGQDCHKMLEYYDEGELDGAGLEQDYRPYLTAWMKFKRDTKIHITGIEKIVYNQTYGYAGTLDRLGIFQNTWHVLLDIKTGQMQPYHAIQTAAYRECLNGKPKIDRYAVYLKADGKYRLEPHKDRNDRKVFLACLAVANWKAKTGGK